jgi:anti-sigma B factor antagonist
MSAPVAKILVQVCGSEVRARVCGRANFAASPDFKALVETMERRGFRQFALDLKDCQIMDSTFVGILASLGGRMEEAGGGSFVELANPNERVAELLDNLGIADLFHMSRRDFSGLAAEQQVDCSAEGHTKAEMSRTSLDAHEKLMELNPDNVAKFKDVTEFLAEDLKRMEGASGIKNNPGSK